MLTEKQVYRIVRAIIALVFSVLILMMFVIEPKGSDSGALNIDNLWEAVHPWHWFFDTVALIGWVAFGLYLAGLLGKTVYAFIEPKSENSGGLIHVIGIAGMLVGLLFFV